ncbi:MAG: hypothetical protein V3T30_04450 [Thermodesulfobacteriota bacterium]
MAKNRPLESLNRVLRTLKRTEKLLLSDHAGCRYSVAAEQVRSSALRGTCRNISVVEELIRVEIALR